VVFSSSDHCALWIAVISRPRRSVIPSNVELDRQAAAGQVRHLAKNAAHPRMTMFTYYVMKSAANYTEGEAELVAMNNAATLNRYLVDWRFLLQTDPGLLQEGGVGLR
jgi:hypothetical protein